MLPPLTSIPDFVLRNLESPRFGVPLLLFHRLAPEELELYLGYLGHNGYQSLDAQEVEAIARGDRTPPARAVALTFDDGEYNNWSVVAPLLRRHGFRAIAFVVPRLLGEGEPRPTIDTTPDAATFEPASGRYMRWSEVEALARDEVIDIQSHTYDHAAVFTAANIIDFQHPRPDGRPRYPWLWSAVGGRPDEPLWGAPVYPMAPRMRARRYRDDFNLREACLRFVAARGGRGFLSDATWRAELERYVTLERPRFGPGRFETDGETRRERLLTLGRARAVLGERLGRPIDHVALPWSSGTEDAPRLIREAGYRSGYTQERPSWRLRAGADPFDLSRLEGYWLRSLPGTGRVSLATRLARRLSRLWRRR